MKSLVIFSGGQDSTTALGWAKNRSEETRAITFDYGQRHIIELEQAEIIAKKLNVPRETFKINDLDRMVDSALVNTYEDISSHHTRVKELPASFVPNRNALFLTIAHAYAQKLGFDSLILGACQTDYSGYPDCRREFIDSMEKSLNLGSGATISIRTPIMYLTKGETFRLARDEGVLDLVLEFSHTCYNGNRKNRHPWGYGCGECPACKLRAKGWDEYARG